MNEPNILPSAAAGYAAKSGNYVRGRPDYPAAAASWLRNGLGLAPGRRVVELGAGTGKFTRYLAETGARVIAVEPVREMRARLSEALPDVEAAEGVAEAIPLADGSADVVMCAQSFHWFATRAALAEIHRVLKPGGQLGLIWNLRDERVGWVAKLTRIIDPYEGDTPRFHTGAWRKAFEGASFGPLGEEHFAHAHTGPPEDVIVNRVRSTSFIAALPSDEEARVVARVRALIASEPELAGRDTVTYPYDTVAFIAERL